MELDEKAVRLKVYLGESNHFQGKPAYKAVVQFLREQGIWGATATRGVYGFGKRSVLHAATPMRLSEDLPVIVEAVDSERKIRAVIPELSKMVTGGLITLDDVSVVRHIG